MFLVLLLLLVDLPLCTTCVRAFASATCHETASASEGVEQECVGDGQRPMKQWQHAVMRRALEVLVYWLLDDWLDRSIQQVLWSIHLLWTTTPCCYCKLQAIRSIQTHTTRS
jgi:hypothetical protein